MPSNTKEYRKIYYQENKEARRERNREYGIQYRRENKETLSDKAKTYYQKNKEFYQECSKIYYQEKKETIPHRANRMKHSAKYESKKRNIIFNISSKDIEELWPEDNKCPALGVNFTMQGKNGGSNYSPSLDRIVPELGYIKGNLQIVSFLANRIMSSATPDQVIQVGNYFKKITEKKNAA